jgi:hypothetical protein
MSELVTDEMVDLLARRQYAAMVRVDKYPENAPTWEDFGGPFKERIIEGARAELESFAPLIAGRAFESGARSYAASDPCCGTYHLHEIENPHTGEKIPTREGEDDL